MYHKSGGFILNLYPFPALVSLNLNACCISHILLRTSILLFCMIMHDYKVDVDRNLDNSCMITLSLSAVEAAQVTVSGVR